MRTVSPNRHGRGRQCGVSAIETLLAAPIVLLLGLTALQWGLVFHGRHAVAHAAHEGARAASIEHASDVAVERGLARGLAPWLFGASSPQAHVEGIARTRAHLAAGRAAGWVAWRRLAPTRESFVDWAEAARDNEGIAVPGQREIPNDNLALCHADRLPASGIAGYRGTEPIGIASGQTLNDANLLKIEFVYGVPLTVPVVGRLAAWAMRALDGCGDKVAPMRLGTVDLGTPGRSTNPRAWTCAHYDAVDARGAPRPRWPVRVSATLRMQSPARDTGDAPAAGAPAQPAPSLGHGVVDGREAFLPLPVDAVNPAGAGPTEDGSVDRAPGFLKFGGDRLVEPPVACDSG